MFNEITKEIIYATFDKNVKSYSTLETVRIYGLKREGG